MIILQNCFLLKSFWNDLLNVLFHSSALVGFQQIQTAFFRCCYLIKCWLKSNHMAQYCYLYFFSPPQEIRLIIDRRMFLSQFTLAPMPCCMTEELCLFALIYRKLLNQPELQILSFKSFTIEHIQSFTVKGSDHYLQSAENLQCLLKSYLGMFST